MLKEGNLQAGFRRQMGFSLCKKYTNSRGILTSVAEKKGGTVGVSIVIPAGRYGEGWEGEASAIEKVIFASTKLKQCTEGGFYGWLDRGGGSSTKFMEYRSLGSRVVALKNWIVQQKANRDSLHQG